MNNVQEILSKPYTRRLTPDEGGGYLATILEFPGCIADGDTADEALANLERIAESWVEVSLANGQAIREPIELYGYSGKVALRMPRGLHKQAAEVAEIEDTSLNQLLIAAIARYLGWAQAARQTKAHHVSYSVVVNFAVTPRPSAPSAREQLIIGRQPNDGTLPPTWRSQFKLPELVVASTV